MACKRKNRSELFRPQNRIDAALARIETSNLLLEKKRFSASIYFAGVAVESVLRAFIEKDSKGFDKKHDIKKMSENSSIIPFYRKHDKMGDCFGRVIQYWDNKYRYTDDVKLMSFYQSRGLVSHSNIRNVNSLRNFASQCNEAANIIVARGYDLYQGEQDG